MLDQAPDWQLDFEMSADVEDGADGFIVLKAMHLAKCPTVAGQLPLKKWQLCARLA